MALIFSSLYLDVSLLLVLLTLVTTVYYKYAFGYWKRRHVPYLIPKFPFGNIKPLALKEKNFAETTADMYLEAKSMSAKYIGVFFLAKPFFLAVDPSIIKTILTTEFSSFFGRGFYINKDLDPLSENLFFLSGTKWKIIKPKLTPLFTSAKIKAMCLLLQKPCEQLEVFLKKNCETSQPIHLQYAADSFTVDMITSYAFGLECNSFENKSEISNYGNKYIQQVLSSPTKLGLSYLFPQILSFFNIRMAESEVNDYFLNYLNDAIETRKRSGIVRKDLIDAIISMENKENGGKDTLFKEKNIDDMDSFRNLMAATAFTFLIGGWETSSITVVCCMTELALNKGIQQKLRAEITNTLKKHGNVMTYESVMEMVYLDRVVSETFRKYPPVPNLNRICNKTVTLTDTNLTIEAGTMVWIPVFGIHRDPEYYPNPEQFDPDRFKEEHTGPIFMPFGDGPRNCAGLRLGVLIVKCALISFLRNYKYTFYKEKSNKYVPKLAKMGFTLRLADEVYLLAEKI